MRRSSVSCSTPFPVTRRPPTAPTRPSAQRTPASRRPRPSPSSVRPLRSRSRLVPCRARRGWRRSARATSERRLLETMTDITENPGAARLTIPVALERLRGSQKSSKGAAAYSRYVNRPLGRLFAAVGATIGLTPNQVTAISAVCTFTGIVLVATVPPSLLLGLGVTLLLLVGYALDSADGQIARLRGGGSLAGEWLDHVVDAVKTTSVHIAVLIAWYRFTELDPVWLLVPLGYLLADNARFFGLILSDFMRRVHRGSSAMILKRAGKTSLFYSLAVLPFDYGLLLLSFLLLAWMPAFVTLYSLLFLANLLGVPVAFVRWF